MIKINKLPDEVVSKIAAGEVIERPAYAVKELIENAIDANAKLIKIEIENAGLQKIAVYDDGEGMSKEDLRESFKPHTTSKIKSEEELIGVKSLGFRGEALSSIASISNLTIKSKQKKSQEGTEIEIAASKVKNISSIGMPTGTHVIVENLFSTVPARKKFLKTIQTEYRHIVEVVVRFVLSNPQIAFEFKNNGKLVFKFNKKDKIDIRLQKLLGETSANNLISVKHQDSYLDIRGFISKPQEVHYNAQQVYLFVNGRAVSDSGIINSLKEGYGNLLEHHSYPMAVLFIKLPFEAVDVNVHPRKEAIKFIDPREVYSIILSAVKNTLEKNNLTFYNISWKDKTTRTSTANILREIVESSDIGSLGKIKKDPAIVQLHNLYIIAETKTGLMFIDQHAAHEAILYRKFSDEYKKQKSRLKRIRLKKSLLINTSLAESEIINEHSRFFEQIGFEMEEFGDNTFKINAIPKTLEGHDVKDAIKEFIDDLKEEKLPKDISRRINKMLSYLACRSAIKSGQHLETEDIKKLIDNLEEEDYIYTCPHGRPVKMEFSLKFLDKLFRRH